jgi:hypothetical protein
VPEIVQLWIYVWGKGIGFDKRVGHSVLCDDSKGSIVDQVIAPNDINFDRCGTYLILSFKMSNRQPIPKDVEAAVLTKCRRRCCICFGLSGNLSEKSGQIAHLDDDPSNNAPDNLAYLCLEHHDRYDGHTSQSKGLTIYEVNTYRKSLWEAIERNLHHHAASAIPSNPKLIEILKWKNQLISVHRYQAVEASMQHGWVPQNQRDYRVTDCDENCVHYHDTVSGTNLAASLEDVKIEFDTVRQRLLLTLTDAARRA